MFFIPKFFSYLKRSLWLFPFLFFIAGYQFLAHIYLIEHIKTPHVMGKPVQEALTILSNNNLNARLLSHKEDAHVPAGTVISQVPQPTTKIKPNQSVFLIVSIKPPTLKAPQYTHKTLPEIISNAQESNSPVTYYYLDSHYPKDLCIAQFPTPGKELEDGTVIVYISSGKSKPVLLPNFKNQHVPNVMEFLENHGITATLTHSDECDPCHICNQHCTITDQRPLAGSLITLDKPPHLQFQVRAIKPAYF